jgi:type III secretion protein T
METPDPSLLPLLKNLFVLEVRPAMALGFSPFFGLQTIVGLPRRSFFVLVSVMSCFMLWPVLAGRDLTIPELIMMVAHEAIIGILLGFTSGIPFWVMESVGQVIDLQRGATSGSLFNPMLGSLTSPMGNLLLQFFTMYFYATGGFLLFLSALYTTYEYLPPVQTLPVWLPGSQTQILNLMSVFFKNMVVYAAPFLLVFLLIDSGLGLMNRFVPSLNMFFFSMPIKSILTYVLVLVCLLELIYCFRNDIKQVAGLASFIRELVK